MPDTYTQINIQSVFAVKGRENFLTIDFRYRLFEYMSGIMKGIGLYPLAVDGYTDHVHLLFELPPTMPVSKALQEIKSNSSKWINEQGFLRKKFQWQNGYGAFSYSKSQRDSVIKYIMNQQKHHLNQTFREEYLKQLIKFEIEFDDKYLFEFYD